MRGFSKKSVAVLIVVFACMTLQLYAQTADKVSENSNITTTQNGSQPVDENAIPITGSGTASAAKSGSRGQTFLVFLRMIVVLALVIACIYGVIWLMKRGMRTGNNSDPFMRVVSSITLSPGKTVQIVTLLDHAYLIGVTDNAVNLIGEVSDKELVDAMNLYADKNENTKKPRNFNDILSIFMPNGPKEKNKNVFEGTAATAEDLLKQQRDRLNKGE